MKMPFTTEQFMQVIKAYNLSVWPMQVVFYILCLIMLYFVFKKDKQSDRIIYFGVAFLWFWMGLVYHFGFFTSINKAAYVFGFLTALQGFVFIITGIRKSSVKLSFRPDIFGITGLVFIVYALVIYPAIGYFAGHAYPNSPTLGLPCPTTIFTFGILLSLTQKVPIWVLAIPVIWSVIGASAAINFGIWEDIGLLIAGVAGSILILYRNYKLLAELKSQKIKSLNAIIVTK